MNLSKRENHTCIASHKKREMKSTFSWTNPFKSSTSSTLCFGEPTLGKFNQVKLLCISTSSTLCDPTLAKLNQATEFCITIDITFDDSVVHTGTTFSLPSSSFETSQVSSYHSSLGTTPCSRRILDKLMIEVTKDIMHPIGKNGEHLIKSNQHMDILHAFINYARASFNHGLSPSEVDWGNPKAELTEMLKYTSNRCMFMEVDWGGNLKLIHTSCGCVLMEVDWGGKLILNSMVEWQTDETHSNGHRISEVDWGGHGSSSNHMTEFWLSDVDWGAHDSSFFLFLVNIDYDAKPMEFFILVLWGELQ